MSSPTFLFVQVQHTGKVPPGKDVRTAIQKHVMRDIGAARRGRPRRQLKNKNPPNQDQTLTQLNLSSSLVSGGARMNPFAEYPIPMNSDALFLIDYLYTCPKPRLRTIRDTWLPISLSDPALFYEILSHISQDIAAASPVHSEHRRSLEFHSLALHSVNKRLSDPVSALSDGIIGTLLAFACFSHLAKDWKSYNMHMDGLLIIIRLKGGVHALDHNKILRLLLSGIDVSASCFNNIPPKFPLPLRALSNLREEGQEIPWWLPVDSTSVKNVWQLVFPSNVVLSDIFRDLTTTIMTVKLENNRRLLWQDKRFASDYIDPLTHRLLESTIEMDAIDASNFRNECLRLAALILLSRIRRSFERRIVFTGLETDKIKILLRRYHTEWTMFKPMLLWVLVLEALEMEGEERMWTCNLLARTAEGMGLDGWDDVIANASNLLWVGDLMDKECEALRPLMVIR